MIAANLGSFASEGICKQRNKRARWSQMIGRFSIYDWPLTSESNFDGGSLSRFPPPPLLAKYWGPDPAPMIKTASMTLRKLPVRLYQHKHLISLHLWMRSSRPKPTCTLLKGCHSDVTPVLQQTVYLSRVNSPEWKSLDSILEIPTRAASFLHTYSQIMGSSYPCGFWRVGKALSHSKWVLVGRQHIILFIRNLYSMSFQSASCFWTNQKLFEYIYFLYVLWGYI